MKKLVQGLLILVVIAVLAIAGGLYALDYLEPETKPEVLYTNDKDYILPSIQVKTDGHTLNELAGYTMQMNQSNLRSSVVPISDSRQMSITFKDEEIGVTKIAWKVYTLSGQKLLEEGTADEWETAVKRGEAQIQYSPLIEEGNEYDVEFILTQQNGRVCYYYTRILMQDIHVWEHVEFAEKFIESTFDKTVAAAEIVPYMQKTTDTEIDLKHATLASPFRELTWLDLKPTRTTEPVVTITELYENESGLQSTLVLNYEIQSEAGQEYEVTECYTLRTLEEKIYLTDFQRDVVQKVDVTNMNYASGKLSVGVGNDQFDVLMSPDRESGAMISGEYLWAYDNGEMKLIYSLDTNYHFISEQTQMELLSAQDNGDVSFLVSGYLATGIHAGTTGIVAYCYEKEKNSLRELFYVQTDTSGEILQELVHGYNYLSSGGNCYFLCENKVYCVDVNENTIEVVAQTSSDAYVQMSKDREIMAWTQTQYADKIELIDFETGTLYEIEAEEGKFFVLEGFLGDAVVYGTVSHRGSGEIRLEELEISGLDGTVYSHYEKENTYIENVQVGDTTVAFELVHWEDGEYVSDGNETIMVTQTQSKQSEIYFVSSASGDYIDLSAWESKDMKWDSEELLTQVFSGKTLRADIGSRENKYYSYAAGHLCGISETPGALVDSVYSLLGVIVDENQTVVWARRPRNLYVTLNVALKTAENGKSLNASLKMLLDHAGQDSSRVDEALADGKTTYEIMQETFGAKALDVTGATMISCYYYINLGTPILIQTGKSEAVLVTAFTPQDVTVYDPTTGESQTKSLADMEMYVQNSVGMYTYLR